MPFYKSTGKYNIRRQYTNESMEPDAGGGGGGKFRVPFVTQRVRRPETVRCLQFRNLPK